MPSLLLSPAPTTATDDLTWEQTHRALIPMMRPNNYINAFYLAAEYAFLTTVLVSGWYTLAAWQADTLSTWTFVPLALFEMLLVAVSQHRLSGLGHEASHYALFRNRWANDLVSDFFCMMPMFAITQQFRASHMRHHQHINDAEHDPDVVRLGNRKPGRFPMAAALFRQRYVWGAFFPPTLWAYIYGQAVNANRAIPGTKPIRNVYSLKVAIAMQIVFWAAILTFVRYHEASPFFWLFWVGPLLTFYPFLMQLREIAHHSNTPTDDDLLNSRIFDVHPVMKAAVFPYGQVYHVTHHMFALLPHYRMAKAHTTLRRYAPYREKVVTCTGYFFRRRKDGLSVLDVLANPQAASA